LRTPNLTPVHQHIRITFPSSFVLSLLFLLLLLLFFVCLSILLLFVSFPSHPFHCLICTIRQCCVHGVTLPKVRRKCIGRLSSIRKPKSDPVHQHIRITFPASFALSLLFLLLLPFFVCLSILLLFVSFPFHPFP